MERVIAPNQNGFVKGRAISNSILLASELMTFIHKARKVKTKWVLEKYASLAGQVLNKDKSTVIFSPNTPRQFKRIMASTLGAKTSNKLGKYLGVKIDSRFNSADLFNDLVEKVEFKLAGWKSRLLSQSGRLTLIKSVLQASPIYQLSVLPMPNKYADRIDALSTNFYWGHNNNKSSIHLAPKQTLFKSRDSGGLGLHQTSLFNKALMAKQVWRVVSQPTSVYSQWARAKYFNNNMELLPKKTTQPAAIWRCLDKSGSLIFYHLWWKIATGEQVPLGSRFWWPLQTSYPSQHQNVAALINSETKSWNQPLVNQLFAASVASNILHSPLPLCNSADSYIWKFSVTGEYKVSEGYQLLSDTRHQNNPSQFFPWKFL
ncbi:ribonuclease H [Senna tora]|uniref:Ribonuclease H n=1 Tax=Senna tora TaxID=362788 RepID=A0A834WFA4_9FABA|nr:ribonuclease H [Senna tora]